MIKFIYEIVCRFTYSLDVSFKNRQKLTVYVTTIVGNVDNWRLTPIPAPLGRGAAVKLDPKQAGWANALNERWAAVHGSASRGGSKSNK
jgi:hypothetical protein